MEWSGVNWYLSSSETEHRSVSVIEPARRKAKQSKKSKQVPYGFAQALPKKKRKKQKK
jgi:hypothetical protein